MLEFIVLGIVPGTHFNITFSWVLGAAAVFLMILEVRYHKQYALKVQTAESAAVVAEVATEIIKPQPTLPKKKKKTAKAAAATKKSPKKAVKKTAAKKKTQAKAAAAKKRPPSKTNRRQKA